jgi:3-oxoacyl-[acyl-carrier-protein] synthase II
LRRRIAVTGIGTVSGAGRNTEAFRAALRQGQNRFTEIGAPEVEKWKATHAALVPDAWLEPLPAAYEAAADMDRVVHLSLKAMGEALDSAGLEPPLGDRAALVLGTCSGGMLSIEKHYRALARHRDILDEALLFSKRYYTPAKVVAWAAGVGGPVLTIVTACAAGAGAIAAGADLIRSGLVDVALAGGADTFALSTLAGFDALKATCGGVCAPFSENIGLNLGEGSGFLVLEEMGHAIRRSAAVLAEIAGAGLSNDAYHPTSPDPSAKGQVAAIHRALRDAGLEPSRIEYINAHGTGTRANDPIECRSIRKVFGAAADTVPTSSTKSVIGHCLGAAGALEAAATIIALRDGFLPSTAGFTTPRDGCPLGDFVPDAGRPFTGHVALTNSFGFGGHNACLVLNTAPSPSAVAADLSDEDVPVITGVGAVHALGLGVSALPDPGASGIRRAGSLRHGGRPVDAGLVPDIDPREVDRRLDVRGMDRCSRFATYAARLALEHAGQPLRPSSTSEIGMILGLSTGPTEGESSHLKTCFESREHIDRVDAFPYVVQNEVAGHAARSLMLRGHHTVISGGWGAGLSALISGALALGQGHTEAVVATASDELTDRTLSDGCAVGVWGPGTALIPGEGAAAFLLESRRHAAARGAAPLAEILGFGVATDTESITRATGRAIGRAIALAVKRSGIDPGGITGVATTLHARKEGEWEAGAAREHFGNAEIVCLSERLGFAESAAPLLGLACLLATSSPGDLIAATRLSEEGLADALILRVVGNRPV